MREIFIHVGIHKTGSTFLQKNIFPNWPEVNYFHGRNSLRSILTSGTIGKKILLSDECFSAIPWNTKNGWATQRKQYLDNMREFFPHAKVMICVRKHASLLLSFYKQYLHEGGTLIFDDFFNFKGQSLINPLDLYYENMLKYLESICEDVFVFSFHSLWNESEIFLMRLAGFMKTQVPQFDGQIFSKRVNTGVRYYPAKLLRVLNIVTKSNLNTDGFLPLNHKLLRKHKLHPRGLCQSRLNIFFTKEVELSADLLSEINNYYQEDWSFVNNKYLNS